MTTAAAPAAARICLWCGPPHVITPGTMHNATHTLCPEAFAREIAKLPNPRPLTAWERGDER